MGIGPVLITIFLIGLFSCGQPEKRIQPKIAIENTDTIFRNLKLRIVSPFDCMQEINLDSEGRGFVATGIANEDIDYEYVGLDSVIYSDSMIVPSKIMDSIRFQTEPLIDLPLEKKARKADAYRFKLYVNDVCKSDAGDTRIIFNVLLFLSDYFPKNAYLCGYLSLWKDYQDKTKEK